jgi:hypothetical protein
MNKTILILTCWLLGLASGMAQQRKIADVQHLADSVLNRPTRWGKKVKAVKTKRIVAASEIQKDSQDAFYICDAGEDGYAIISADERMTPVLGFSQSRGFDTSDIPAGLQELLEGYTHEYEALINEKPARPARRKLEGVKEQVGPLFTTQWGQRAPFNNRCPELNGERCVTGCVAISTSQTLYYYKYPESATGTVNYVTRTNSIPIQEDLSTFKFNWPFIKGVYKYGATEDECDAVANLVYACAVAVQMDFGIKESASNSIDQIKALVENFGYDPDIAHINKDCMTTNEWQSLMLNELNNGRPIVYAAISPSAGGHSFIIDGYKADESGYPFYHVNWGWEGNFDDYYKLSAMEADGDEYTQSHEAVIYIQPDNGIRDSEIFWQAKEVILSTARINPIATRKFSITLNNLFNFSYKTFSGTIEFYLQDANYREILVATKKLNNVPFCYGLSTLSVDATLPYGIAEGDYTLIIRSKATDSEKYETVSYPSPQSLTVSTITESYTPNMMVNDLTNMGEGWNGLSMSVRATLPRNGAVRPFTGWLQMAVADEDGNILQHFGRVYYITNLEMGYYQPIAVTFEGQLPEYLEDGSYRLYLVANQSGYLEWGKVTQYKIENDQIKEGIEAYIPFWLEDGKILYHKEGEENLPEYYADIQVTDMQVTGFNSDTKHIDMQMSNVINMGTEPFTGQFSMVVYDCTDKLITEFGEPQRISSVLNHYSMISNKSFNFSGNLPNELEDGTYTIKIAAKQNGCRGWSPIKGWAMMGNYIVGKDVDLNFDFSIMYNKMYKVDTDGLMTPIDNIKEGTIYNLNGIQTQNTSKKGIYIIDGRKVVR